MWTNVDRHILTVYFWGGVWSLFALRELLGRTANKISSRYFHLAHGTSVPNVHDERKPYTGIVISQCGGVGWRGPEGRDAHNLK